VQSAAANSGAATEQGGAVHVPTGTGFNTIYYPNGIIYPNGIPNGQQIANFGPAANSGVAGIGMGAGAAPNVNAALSRQVSTAPAVAYNANVATGGQGISSTTGRASNLSPGTIPNEQAVNAGEGNPNETVNRYAGAALLPTSVNGSLANNQQVGANAAAANSAATAVIGQNIAVAGLSPGVAANQQGGANAAIGQVGTTKGLNPIVAANQQNRFGATVPFNQNMVTNGPFPAASTVTGNAGMNNSSNGVQWSGGRWWYLTPQDTWMWYDNGNWVNYGDTGMGEQ
jgi:hypothetical protein